MDDDELQVDLGEFTTVDSVGDIDYVQVDDPEGEEKNEDGTIKEKPLVGRDHVKTVEALYCEVCRYFLPKNREPELALRKHCNARSHLRNHLRFIEEEALRQAAEAKAKRRQEEDAAKKAKEAGRFHLFIHHSSFLH